jgi:hypothetical protein
MSTVLDWRDDGGLPHCKVVLASSERVAITLSAGGVQIDMLGWDGTLSDRLFSGNAELATGICTGLLAGAPPQATTPLHILAAAVAGMPSAAAVRAAFNDAARGLPSRRRSESIPRAIVIAILLLGLFLAGRTAYVIITTAPG